MQGEGIYDKRMDDPIVDGVNKVLTERLLKKTCEHPEKFDDKLYPCGRDAVFYDSKMDEFLCQDHGFLSMIAGHKPKNIEKLSNMELI